MFCKWWKKKKKQVKEVLTPRTITSIIVHCTASSDPTITADDIDDWHKARGWRGIGYHMYIRTDGLIERGRDDDVQGAHVKGHNRNSLGVSLNGKKLEDFNDAQFRSLAQVLGQWMEMYKLTLDDIYPHNLYADKACPVFDFIVRIKNSLYSSSTGPNRR